MISSQATAGQEVSVRPNQWFPPLSLQKWQEVYRLEHGGATALQYALENGTLQINHLLRTWRKGLKGVEFPGSAAADYREAVYAKAMALALPLIPALRQPSEAELDAGELGTSPGEFEARATTALARVKGEWAGETGRVHAWCV